MTMSPWLSRHFHDSNWVLWTDSNGTVALFYWDKIKTMMELGNPLLYFVSSSISIDCLMSPAL